MKKITRVIIEGRAFTIVKGERGYYGIEEKDIQNGRITRKLDPVRDNLRDSLGDCINAVEIRVRMEEMLAAGMSPEDAALHVLCSGSAAQR